MARRTLRAMGTDVHLVLDSPPTADAVQALLDAEHELHRLAAMLTRFDPRSELRRLERDRARRCSPELVEVVQLALDARRTSRGRFDPTVLPALRAAGYDRTFRDVRRAPRAATAPVPAGAGVHVDAATGIVALADGAALDLGGIAKGWIADRVAEQLARVAPALVDAGGDVACTPRAGDEPWAIDVVGSDLRIDLPSGGVATSGVDWRRWDDPGTGRTQHHVIDPRTGAPATADLQRVTTVAASCTAAEVAATTLLVAGSTHLLEAAAPFVVAWRAERRDGTVLASPEFR
jgi:thiamine biosynthesis lipoprotein